MGGHRVRRFLFLAALVALGWWIYERRPTVAGFVDDLTRPLMGSRAAVKTSERKRVVADASQVVTLDQDRRVETLREGMSDWDVRALLGDPDAIEPVEDDPGDRVRWVYRTARRVVLLQRGRVVSVAIR
jgi:hypothetical protein